VAPPRASAALLFCGEPMADGWAFSSSHAGLEKQANPSRRLWSQLCWPSSGGAGPCYVGEWQCEPAKFRQIRLCRQPRSFPGIAPPPREFAFQVKSELDVYRELNKSVTNGKDAYVATGDSIPQQYVVDGEICKVPHDFCPHCWGRGEPAATRCPRRGPVRDS